MEMMFHESNIDLLQIRPAGLTKEIINELRRAHNGLYKFSFFLLLDVLDSFFCVLISYTFCYYCYIDRERLKILLRI